MVRVAFFSSCFQVQKKKSEKKNHIQKNEKDNDEIRQRRVFGV
jgi:hypothetical protein